MRHDRIVEARACPRCGEIKAKTEFRMKGTVDGRRRNICGTCEDAWQREHRTRRRSHVPRQEHIEWHRPASPEYDPDPSPYVVWEGPLGTCVSRPRATPPGQYEDPYRVVAPDGSEVAVYTGPLAVERAVQRAAQVELAAATRADLAPAQYVVATALGDWVSLERIRLRACRDQVDRDVLGRRKRPTVRGRDAA